MPPCAPTEGYGCESGETGGADRGPDASTRDRRTRDQARLRALARARIAATAVFAPSRRNSANVGSQSIHGVNQCIVPALGEAAPDLRSRSCGSEGRIERRTRGTGREPSPAPHAPVYALSGQLHPAPLTARGRGNLRFDGDSQSSARSARIASSSFGSRARSVRATWAQCQPRSAPSSAPSSAQSRLSDGRSRVSSTCRNASTAPIRRSSRTLAMPARASMRSEASPRLGNARIGSSPRIVVSCGRPARLRTGGHGVASGRLDGTATNMSMP